MLVAICAVLSDSGWKSQALSIFNPCWKYRLWLVLLHISTEELECSGLGSDKGIADGEGTGAVGRESCPWSPTGWRKANRHVCSPEPFVPALPVWVLTGSIMK